MIIFVRCSKTIVEENFSLFGKTQVCLVAVKDTWFLGKAKQPAPLYILLKGNIMGETWMEEEGEEKDDDFWRPTSREKGEKKYLKMGGKQKIKRKGRSVGEKWQLLPHFLL